MAERYLGAEGGERSHIPAQLHWPWYGNFVWKPYFAKLLLGIKKQIENTNVRQSFKQVKLGFNKDILLFGTWFLVAKFLLTKFEKKNW